MSDDHRDHAHDHTGVERGPGRGRATREHRLPGPGAAPGEPHSHHDGHDDHDHDHEHEHEHGHGADHHGGGGAGHQHDLRGLARRVLVAVLALNLAFLGAELVGGIRFSSLALLADSAHMASDVVGLVLALWAQHLLGRSPSDRHTFGLVRAEVLAAQANGLLTAAAGGWVVVEAISRFRHPPEVQGAGVLAVAAAGLLVNVVSVRLLYGVRHTNLNLRGAFIHMAADAAGSVAAMVAGAAAWLGSAYWVDPAASLLIAALVLWPVWGLLRATTHVLLEGAPRHLSNPEIVAAVTALPEVADVHHLHLWLLASDQVALSGHVVVEGDRSLHDAQVVGDRVRDLLARRFGIHHATLELECHTCEPVLSTAPPGTSGS